MLEIIPPRTRETIQFLVALTESVRYIDGCQTKFAFADAVNELEELVNKLIGG